MRGYTKRHNELGFASITVHYKADPDKDYDNPDPDVKAAAERWFELARRAFPDPNKWAQEMELNWWVSSGTRVFPQFTMETHTKELMHRPRKILCRAWDFGWLTPACLIAQVDEKDRLTVLREIIGKEQTTKDFAQSVLDICVREYPSHSAGFRDFCDPAGQQASSTASEKSEVRDVDVLKALGIYPSWDYGWSRKDGRSLIHQLLAIRLDGTPSFFLDGLRCPVLLQGFLGKYVYPAKKGGTAHDEPDEANHPWSDAMACLRYLATGLYTALGLSRPGYHTPQAAPPNTFTGYGTPKRRPKGAQQAFKG